MKVLFSFVSLVFYLLGDLFFKLHFWWGYRTFMNISYRINDRFGGNVWKDVENIE